MEMNDMVAATAPTPTVTSKSAAKHLGLSIEDAVRRRHRNDSIGVIIAGAGAAIALPTAVMLCIYVMRGHW